MDSRSGGEGVRAWKREGGRDGRIEVAIKMVEGVVEYASSVVASPVDENMVSGGGGDEIRDLMISSPSGVWVRRDCAEIRVVVDSAGYGEEEEEEGRRRAWGMRTRQEVHDDLG